MQILFIDESGTPPSPQSPQRYFVIGGITIPDTLWRTVKNELDSIKQEFSISGEVKWRFFAFANQREENTMRHLNQEERDTVRSRIFEIITKRKAIKAMSVVTDATEYYKNQPDSGADDLYQHTYKPITERFQYYLQDFERDSGNPTYGIIVCDHRAPKEDRRLQELHQRLLNSTSNRHSTYKNLVEGLFIAPSHWSVGIQLADMVAGAVYRKFSADDDTYFSQIESSFRKSPSGDIRGYGLVLNKKG